ncbi:MAG: imidazole glycerol phosphate synthase subunit HisH [Cyanobacteriota bacterium]|nr:imidazole glycerol phosphate synthase subunit HisH [Cyanobacteriota bacterium]
MRAAVQWHNCDVAICSHPPREQQTVPFSHAVLPGVGSFATGMRSLVLRGWDHWLREHWQPSQRPLLGICLGMQLLASEGSEGIQEGAPMIQGLGLVPGTVQRLPPCPGFTLPHVGWNTVDFQSDPMPLAAGLPPRGDFYFLHSYALQVTDPADALATTEYGSTFTAVVGRGHCFGVQFHPEKSQKLGRRLLANFLQLAPC